MIEVIGATRFNQLEITIKEITQ